MRDSDTIDGALASRGLAAYELGEEIGSGAFGVVYRAHQPSIGRDVVIKVIKPEWANHPEFIRRFELEAQLVARLEHPHVVPLYDYWREPDGAFLVMRWLRAGSLKERLESGSLSLDETTRLVDQIGSALAAAHRGGVVHRDLKPANVLLDEEGNAYLTDFGVAKDLDATETMTAAGAMSPGSPAYMTPEQVEGRRVDARSDIYSFGLLLYECLAGRRAFDTDSLVSLISSQLSEPVPLLRPDHPDIPNGVDDVLQRATAKDPEDRYADMLDLIDEWHRALGGESDLAAAAERYTPTRNPYKGLSAFAEFDAADFYGRDGEIGQLLEAVADQRLTAVIGPSGVGKSSVVRAGLIPALRSGGVAGSERWMITDMLPGGYPFESFASALLRVAATSMPGLDDDLHRDRRGMLRAANRLLPQGAELVVVIDQFEELFTVTADDGIRNLFMDSLVTLVTDRNSNVRVVITMRADFIDRPLLHPELGEILRANTVLISAPTEDQVREIIERPADSVGVRFEPGLVDRIMGDVATEPGALPLLEYSLTELFEARDRDLLTASVYEESGGVLGALGRRAAELYGNLEPASQAAGHDVFLRLVTVTDASQDTRRRVLRSDLDHIDAPSGAVGEVLEVYGRHRLLSFDRDPATRGPTVEVAHEAIFREWLELAGWIDEEREDLLLHGRLVDAVREWEDSGGDEAFLLRGGRLAQHEEWVVDTRIPLTDAEKAFLGAGRLREDERATARQRRRRLIMIGFGVAAVVATALAVFGFIQRQNALDERDVSAGLRVEAETQAGLAQAEAARAEAEAARAEQQAALAEEQAALAQAETTRAESEATRAETEAARAEEEAAAALQAGRLALARELALQSSQQLEVNPERSVLLAMEAIEIGREAGIDVPEAIAAAHRAVQAQRIVARYPGRGFVTVSPDGTLAATIEAGGGVAVLSTDTGSTVTVLERDAFPIGARFSPDGGRLGVLYSDVSPPLWVWDLETGGRTEYDGEALVDEGPPFPVSFSSDGAMVITHLNSGSRVWNASTRELAYDIPVIGQAEFSPTQDVLAVGDELAATIRILTGSTGVETATWALEVPPQSIAFSQDGTRLAVLSQFGEYVAVHDVAGGDELIRVPVQGANGEVAWFSDGIHVIAGSDSGVATVVDTNSGVATELRGQQGTVWAVETIPGTNLAVTTDPSAESVLVWNTEPGLLPEVSKLATGVANMRAFGYIGDGDSLFVSVRDDVGSGMVMDATTAEPMLALDGLIRSSPFLESRPMGDGSLLGSVEVGRVGHLRSLADGAILYTAPVETFVKAVTQDGSRAVISSQAWQPDESLMRVEVVDLATGETVAGFDHPGAGYAEFSADGSLVWTWYGVTWDYYDATTGELVLTLDVFVAPFFPDGETLAVIDVQGVLYRADLAALIAGNSLEEASEWQVKAHDGFTPLIKFNPDGSLVMTGGFDEPVKVWDATDGSLVVEFDSGFSIDSEGGEFHPTRPHVTLRGDGGVLFTYTLDTDELLDIARSRVTRDLSDAECRAYLHVDSCDQR